MRTNALAHMAWWRKGGGWDSQFNLGVGQAPARVPMCQCASKGAQLHIDGLEPPIYANGNQVCL